MTGASNPTMIMANILTRITSGITETTATIKIMYSQCHQKSTTNQQFKKTLHRRLSS